MAGVLMLLLVVLAGCSAQRRPGVDPSLIDLRQDIGGARGAAAPIPDRFYGSMIYKLKVSGKGYSHTETHTWEVTGPSLSAEGHEFVFPAVWSATGSGSASHKTPSTQWDAQWTINANQSVRLSIQPLSDPDRWIFGHWSAQAVQRNGVTGSETLKTVGMRPQPSVILQGAGEATLGTTLYLPRDATNVVTGKFTRDQPVGNLGPGFPRDAKFTAEWTWRFTPEGTSPAECEKKFKETHVYSKAREATQKLRIDTQILGGDFCYGAAIDMRNEEYLKKLISNASGGSLTVLPAAQGLQFFIVKGGGEGFLADRYRGIDASDVTRQPGRFDDNDLIAVFDKKGKLISSALLQRSFSIPGKITQKTADKVYDAWDNRPVSLYKNENFVIKYFGLKIDDSLGEYRSGRVRIDIHKQEDTNGCIFIVDEDTPLTSETAKLNAFEPRFIVDVMRAAGVKENIGIMHMVTIR
jgi:hypothetical protein